jgi:hypothetical protein
MDDDLTNGLAALPPLAEPLAGKACCATRPDYSSA